MSRSAWFFALRFISRNPAGLDSRRVLSTMNAEQLFHTAIVSTKLYRAVANYLDHLKDYGVDVEEGDDDIVSSKHDADKIKFFRLQRSDYLDMKDRLQFARVSRYSAAIVAMALQTNVGRILKRFDLHFGEMRLMQAATGSLVSGSSIPALMTSCVRFIPRDLDIYTESLTDNPLDAIAHFHSTCVFGAWSSQGFWHAYAGLTFAGLSMSSPVRLPLNDDLDSHQRVWRIVRKYYRRGFRFVSQYDPGHVCGVDYNCPCTMRSSNDEGCLFISFPDWEFGYDAVPTRTTTWSLNGVGCKSGILSAARSATAVLLFLTYWDVDTIRGWKCTIIEGSFYFDRKAVEANVVTPDPNYVYIIFVYLPVFGSAPFPCEVAVADDEEVDFEKMSRDAECFKTVVINMVYHCRDATSDDVIGAHKVLAITTAGIDEFVDELVVGWTKSYSSSK
ncbi:hypothetical protein DFH06DRAFT_1152836 [Mycena polygramma]|nr:hypothetical protein DFH06DRAFT_1152836 [Mycena polygramma]